MSYSVISRSESDTELFASENVDKLRGKTIFLIGQMGAGKTTFVKYLAKYLGFAPDVYSPTFSIANRYESSDKPSDKPLIHIDLYRIESEDELDMTGFYEIISEDATVVIEWADKFDIARYIKNSVTIKFTKLSADSRQIEMF